MFSQVVIVFCFTSTIWADSQIRENHQLFQNMNNNLNSFNLNRLQDRFMNGLLRGKNSVCNGTGTMANTRGVCKPQKECRKQGGIPSGSCALVGSCCILERSCNNGTRAKVSYFTSTTTFQADCQFRINLFNSDVCQIRLDFEQFMTEGPQNAGTFDCSVDTFTVTGAAPLGFQALCGNNTGQHIYIPVNASRGANAIELNMRLRPDRQGVLAMPMWRIRVTQLECGTSNKDFSSVPSALTTLYQDHKNKKGHKAANDETLIAPDGCLQYYPDRQGTYESFNYNGGAGLMIANTNYAICFKRFPEDCGIRHTFETFQIGTNALPSTNVDAACNTLQTGQTDPLSQDWLLIPGGTFTDTTAGTSTFADYYCGVHPAQFMVTSQSAGPFMVSVNTDNVAGASAELGFKNTYNVLNTGC